MALAKSLDNGGPATEVAGYTDKVALRRLVAILVRAGGLGLAKPVARDFSRWADFAGATVSNASCQTAYG